MTNAVINTTEGTLITRQAIVDFQLQLADGSSVTVPCTAINNAEGTSVVAAALHHLIQRVDYLESELKKTQEENT
tara:strand:+ start:392 stop:616 length:225 start_codon:yes stop_codon:yes gene_type:complete